MLIQLFMNILLQLKYFSLLVTEISQEVKTGKLGKKKEQITLEETLAKYFESSATHRV